MLGRGLVIPRVRELILFLVLLHPALLAFAIPAPHPDQIQPQAFYRSGFPPRYTLLQEHHVQHLIVKDNSSHLGGCSSDEQGKCQNWGGEVVCLPWEPMCFGAALCGVSFSSYHDSEALNEIYLL